MEIPSKIDWAILEWTGTPQMDRLGRPYVSERPTASGILGAGKLRNDAMMNSANL